MSHSSAKKYLIEKIETGHSTFDIIPEWDKYFKKDDFAVFDASDGFQYRRKCLFTTITRNAKFATRVVYERWKNVSIIRSGKGSTTMDIRFYDGDEITIDIFSRYLNLLDKIQKWHQSLLPEAIQKEISIREAAIDEHYTYEPVPDTPDHELWAEELDEYYDELNQLNDATPYILTDMENSMKHTLYCQRLIEMVSPNYPPIRNYQIKDARQLIIDVDFGKRLNLYADSDISTTLAFQFVNANKETIQKQEEVVAEILANKIYVEQAMNKHKEQAMEFIADELNTKMNISIAHNAQSSIQRKVTQKSFEKRIQAIDEKISEKRPDYLEKMNSLSDVLISTNKELSLERTKLDNMKNCHYFVQHSTMNISVEEFEYIKSYIRRAKNLTFNKEDKIARQFVILMTGLIITSGVDKKAAIETAITVVAMIQEKDEVSLLSYFVAMIARPDGEAFEYNKAIERASWFKNLPIKTAFSIATFFLQLSELSEKDTEIFLKARRINRNTAT